MSYYPKVINTSYFGVSITGSTGSKGYTGYTDNT